MRTHELALIGLFTAACVAPSQHDEARYGARRVLFAPSTDGVWDWSQDQRQTLRTALAAASALGPTFVEATDAQHADIVTRDWDSGALGCSLGAGQYTVGSVPALVEINPTCVSGLALQAAAIHEWGHALGMQHVCATTGELPLCSPVGVGIAVMNPAASYGDPIDQGLHTGVAQSTPTDLDLAEYRRVHP